ncbi:RNA-directed DNA polymerase, eukaryota, partial [Tanacetum coccineum]
YWKTIDKDVVKAVEEFFVSSNFPPGSNTSFITLIPKTQDAKMVKDFRPISLIGSIYKIIAKILANRLSLVILYLKTKAMIFKVDFEKAFDSVRWDFLDDILDKFGFGAKWRGWIQGCLNSAMGSILVNGNPTSEFKFHKGLKQGEPLSPFLFILIMESLHLSFNHILNAGLFKGIQIDNSLTLSHLFYADDAVFIGKWDKSNLITIVNMLKCFLLASGLKINIHKSKLMGIGIPHEEVISAANFIGCAILTMPFNYLGVKVGAHSSRSSSWEEVIAKLYSRLSKWKLKTLSIGGRLTLIKSVLSSMPLYHMSIYKVPLGVLNKMESLRLNFFNGVDNKERKLSMIGWKKIWRFISHEASLWSRFIKAMYGVRGFLDNPGSLSRNSPWSDIIKEAASLSLKGINFLSYVKKKVGNGEHTCFWEDVWLDDHPLKLSFPRLYALECDKEVCVAAKLIDSSLTVGSVTRWVHAVTIKINVFAWKVCLDKLPTSILCPVCHSAGESSSHLFFSCNVARHLLMKIARWWELDAFDFHSYEDWISWLTSLRLAKGLKAVLEGVFYVMWWVIWKFRNQVLFGTTHPRLELLFDEIEDKEVEIVGSTKYMGQKYQ